MRIFSVHFAFFHFYFFSLFLFLNNNFVTRQFIVVLFRNGLTLDLWRKSIQWTMVFTFEISFCMEKSIQLWTFAPFGERRCGRQFPSIAIDRKTVGLFNILQNEFFYICVFHLIRSILRPVLAYVSFIFWLGYVWCIFERVATSHISSYLSHFDRMLPCHIHTIPIHTHFFTKTTHTISLSLPNSLTLGDIQSE